MRKFQVLASCRRGFLNARDREITISTSNSQALRYASLTDELLASRMTSCIAFNRYITNGSCYLRPKITPNSGDPRTSDAGSGASLLVDPGPEEGNTRDTSTREMGQSDKRSPRSSLRRADTQADLKFYSSSAKADFIQGLLKEFSSSKGNPLSAFPKSTPEVFGESDDFGSVAGRLEPAVYEEDEKDEERLALLPPLNQQELQNQYTESMQALCDEGKFADALGLLEEEMPSKKVRPIPYHYRLLIGAAAKLGLADKAFDLFSQLVRRGHTPKPLLYSYLFIACANDAHPTRHAPRIMRLREQMRLRGVIPSHMNYHAMLIAFGRCGAVETAFEVFDELQAGGAYTASTRSFNCLLNACVSDREAGFRHALLLWQKMRAARIRPDIYTFNLLLRCVVDCKSGNPDLLLKLFQEMSGKTENCFTLDDVKRRSSEKVVGKVYHVTAESRHKFEEVDLIERKQNKKLSKQKAGKYFLSDLSSPCEVELHASLSDREKSCMAADMVTSASETTWDRESNSALYVSRGKVDPKIQACRKADQVDINNKENCVDAAMGTSADGGLVDALLRCDEPPQRLALLGGMEAFLEHMAARGVQPNVKTFLTLLWALPDSQQHEEALLEAMAGAGVSPSTALCNMIIKKRCRRGQYDLAKSTLGLLSEHHLQPDVVTFGCLALGCPSLALAKELLDAIDQHHSRPNIIIMVNLAKTAVSTNQYDYSAKLVSWVKQHRIRPNATFIELMEEARARAKQDLKDMENDVSASSRQKARQRRKFLATYSLWLRSAPLASAQTNDKQKHASTTP